MTDRSLTAQQRVVDLLLEKNGSTLKDWLSGRRAESTSYEDIAKQLYVLTDGEISISYTTVKRWLIDFDLLEVAS
ncbi:MAG TPA: hypothetical protein VJA46_06875 [Acidimicrobiia bacterium]|nr:hypothetical protein [Acidimicrobiia bacterium]